MRLVLLGPPGVGKGTQARRIAEECRRPHIATGDILREAIRRGTDVGLKAKSFIDSGKLVPDEVVISIIEQRLSEADASEGFILDGFPRTLPQAEALSTLVKRLGVSLDHAIYFDAPDEILIARISGRRSCRECRKDYHVRFLPPRQEGRCDGCGGDLYQRSDDHEETVRERLRVYHDQTKEVIPYYEGEGLLRKIDADQKPGEVFTAFRKAVS